MTHPEKPGQREVETSPRTGPLDHGESGDEEILFYRGADCLRAHAGRARGGGRLGVPQAGHCGGDVLRVAQEVRRVGSARTQVAAVAGGGKQQAQAVGGQPQPKQSMLQDVVTKKL